MDELQKQKNQMEKQQHEEANSEPVEALDNRAEQLKLDNTTVSKHLQ